MTARMRLVDAARPKKIKKDNCHRTNHARAVQMRARTCYGSLLHDMKIQLSITPLICAALDARCRSGSLRATGRRPPRSKRRRLSAHAMRFWRSPTILCGFPNLFGVQWRKDAASEAASPLFRRLSANRHDAFAGTVIRAPGNERDRQRGGLILSDGPYFGR
jgi:hypothetical protein